MVTTWCKALSLTAKIDFGKIRKLRMSIKMRALRLQAAPFFPFACWLANKCCGGKLRTWFVIVLIAGNDAARIHQMMEGMGKEGQLAGSSEQDRSPVRKSNQSSGPPGSGEDAMDCVHLTGGKVSDDSCQCHSFFKSMVALCKQRGSRHRQEVPNRSQKPDIDAIRMPYSTCEGAILDTWCSRSFCLCLLL